MKIADKMNDSIKTGKTFFSFEFFPPRTDEVRVNPAEYCGVLSMLHQCRTAQAGWRVLASGLLLRVCCCCCCSLCLVLIYPSLCCLSYLIP